MKARRTVALAAVAALAFGVFWESRYYRFGLSLVHPPRLRPTADELARARRIATEVELETSDGLRLRGDFVLPKNGVVVVMAHALGENRMHFLFEGEMLARHGYGALFFDERAHGDSDGDLCTWGQNEQRDVEAAVTYALAHGAKRVATLGFSIGSTAVLLEAAHDPRVSAVIVEAIWPTLEDEMRDKAGRYGFLSHAPTVLAMKRAGVRFAEVRVIDHLGELGDRPKLFIEGTADEDTPVAINQRVFDAAPEPKKLWLAPGATHGGYAEAAPAEYERVVIDFLDRAFR